MKNLKIILIFLLILNSTLFARNHTDNDGFTHSITTITKTNINRNGYIDNNEEKTLTKRTIDEIVGGKKSEKKVIYGDIETIGASVVKVIGNNNQGKEYKYEPLSPMYYSTDKTSITAVKFENEDKVAYKTNSSKATFDFSEIKNEKGDYIGNEITGKKIIFARLYWGASIAKRWDRQENGYDNTLKRYFQDIQGFNKVKFGYPNESGGMNYTTLQALEKDTKWFGSLTNLGFRFQYQASYDVTDIVKKSLGKTTKQRTFSAGNIKVFEGTPPRMPSFISLYDPNDPFYGVWYQNVASPTYAGWALVIVYDFDTTPNHNVKPKGINIYDGIKALTPLYGDASTEMEFKDFYTPISGEFDAALTILSFGAAKEIPAENIQLKKNQYDSYSDDDSVYVAGANSINPKGSQFNSTITRFNKHMNPNKIYNASMDLDIYDISSLMGHGQTHAYAKLSAKVVSYGGGGSMGDEATVGLVAFSTDLYVPNVCYEEKLFYKRQDDNSSTFHEVSTDSGAKTVLKKDDTLRVQLSIKNKTNERVEKLSIITDIDPTSGKYKDNSTYIYGYNSGDSNFILGPHNEDNKDLQKKITNGIKVNVGQGANHSNGGKLDPTDTAFIQYDISLNETFKESTYKATFSNEALNLEYNDGIIIKKCKQKDYFLSIFNIADFKAVNHNFQKNGDPENLYTQLAGKPFKAKIAYINQNLQNNEIPKGPSEDLQVNVEVVESCDGKSVLAKKIDPIKFTREKGIIELTEDKLLINDVYPYLTFRLTYIDPAQDATVDPKDPTQTPKKKTIVNCLSDRFAVRPEKFNMYNTNSNSFLNSADLTNLVGGRNYPDIGVVTVFKKDNTETVATGYTRNLDVRTIDMGSEKGKIEDIVQIIPNPNKNCKDKISSSVLSEISGNKIMAKFDTGKANFYKSGLKNFSYPDIGPAKLILQDSTFTLVDRASKDCITGSNSTTPNTEGKIGCDIKSSFDLTFVPHDILISNITVSDFSNEMTYTSSDSNMYARVLFEAKARIDDANKSIAKLYTKNCYAKNINLKIDINDTIPDYKITNDGKEIKTASDLKKDLLFFDDNKSSKINKISREDSNIGEYRLLSDAFSDATAIGDGEIRFNFDKNITLARNPFAVDSNIFIFNNISDADGVDGAPYVSPATITNANFYYGRTYAPNYEGPRSGFDAQVYYAIFCKGCNTTKYTKITNVSPPQTNNWFVNKTHKDIQGEVIEYKSANFNDGTTKIKPQGTITNGVEIVNLESTFAPKEDVIKMNVSSWLLYNQINPLATTNDFNVKFFNIATGWGGQSLDKDGKDVGVGKVISGEKFDSGKGISERTNKRLDW